MKIISTLKIYSFVFVAAQVDGDDFINLTEDELKGLFPVFKQAKKIRTFMNKVKN